MSMPTLYDPFPFQRIQVRSVARNLSADNKCDAMRDDSPMRGLMVRGGATIVIRFSCANITVPKCPTTRPSTSYTVKAQRLCSEEWNSQKSNLQILNPPARYYRSKRRFPERRCATGRIQSSQYQKIMAFLDCL